mmetsp:Transcript_49423/g.145882  ORF Transcript_49423/g.145882 Transcript_49423/m.145882 type:complete len:204 (+) Transcript_49423:934-1545(+)
MARHVKLHHHADASHARVLDNVGDIKLRVALLRRVGALPQLWCRLGLKRKRLAVGYVPMQHVDLCVRQRIDDAAQAGERLEVPRRVHHEPAVREARRIGDSPWRARHVIGARAEVEAKQLREGLQPAQRTVDGRRAERRSGRYDHQRVRLISLELGVRVVQVGHDQQERVNRSSCRGPPSARRGAFVGKHDRGVAGQRSLEEG